MEADMNRSTFNAPSFAQRITTDEYDRQAVEYTTQMVEQLNADVRNQPEIGAKSTFFQDTNNIQKGLPVFQGKHTRFVYDDDDEEIVDALDVTQEALQNGPQVRTVAQLDADIESASDDENEEEEEEEEYDDEEEIEADNDADTNIFYVHENGEPMTAMDEEQLSALLQNVEMELAAVAIAEQTLHRQT